MDRLPGLKREQLSPEGREVFDQIANPETQFIPAVMGLLLYSPQVALTAHLHGREVRFNTAVPRDVIELVVLAVARELDCKREWAVHVPQALRQGIGQEVIDAIGHRRAPEGLSDEEAVLVNYTQELLRNHRVPQEVFDKVRERFSDTDMIDLTSLIGHYAMLACVMNAYDVEPNPGTAALPD